MLVQPLPHTTDQYLDPMHPMPLQDEGYYIDFNLTDHNIVSQPTTSPYDDISRRDLL
jgi:hypothetical protein